MNFFIFFVFLRSRYLHMRKRLVQFFFAFFPFYILLGSYISSNFKASKCFFLAALWLIRTVKKICYKHFVVFIFFEKKLKKKMRAHLMDFLFVSHSSMVTSVFIIKWFMLYGDRHVIKT